MKVIDLLNKIAKGEEVPKKIITLNSSFEYNEYDNDYYCGNSSLFNEFLASDDLLEEVTPLEIIEEDKKIEIIEEDKKIEKIDLFKGKSKDYVVFNEDIIMSNKINELIDEVNKLKGDK